MNLSTENAGRAFDVEAVETKRLEDVKQSGNFIHFSLQPPLLVIFVLLSIPILSFYGTTRAARTRQPLASFGHRVRRNSMRAGYLIRVVNR
jgi:hypothetical protein